jgi:hypothetical protein
VSRNAAVLLLLSVLPASAGVVARVPTLGASPSASAAASAVQAPALSAPSALAPGLPSALVPAPLPTGPGGYGARVERAVAAKTEAWASAAEAALDDHDALLVGESHGSLSGLRAVARALPRLARSGVGVVGLEGLKAPAQAAVDEWLRGEREALPESAFSFSPARRAALEELYEAARESGVRVVALGLPLENWARQISELAAERGVETVEAVPSDFKDQVGLAGGAYQAGYNETVAEVALERRNRSMAARLREALPPGVKGVAVVGSAHVEGPDDFAKNLFRARGDYGSMARELAALGMKAFSLTFTGGDFVTPRAAADDRLARPRAYDAARRADGAPALIRLGGAAGLWHDGGTVAPLN